MEDLKQKAAALRADTLKMIYEAQSGHPGGSLSTIEILAALYYKKMNIDPKNPNREDRDRFVLSKGHACPALYAVLADLGFFPKKDLENFRQIDSHLQGHPDMTKTPGIDINTGSLGQGISIAVGLAIAAKSNKKDYAVYTLIGDGEMQEGLVWEAAMSAAHYKLDNLTVILDYNNCQIDGFVCDVMDIGNPVEKFGSFGFCCMEADGHNVDDIMKALDAPANGKPKFICAKTIKGKGVSFMENVPGWHGKAPGKDEFDVAMKELGVC